MITGSDGGKLITAYRKSCLEEDITLFAHWKKDPEAEPRFNPHWKECLQKYRFHLKRDWQQELLFPLRVP